MTYIIIRKEMRWDPEQRQIIFKQEDGFHCDMRKEERMGADDTNNHKNVNNTS